MHYYNYKDWEDKKNRKQDQQFSSYLLNNFFLKIFREKNENGLKENEIILLGHYSLTVHQISFICEIAGRSEVMVTIDFWRGKKAYDKHSSCVIY